MRVRLVGGTSGRVRLPIEFKIEVLRLVQNGESAKSAIQTAAATLGIDLPESYVKYAGSHKWRFVREVGLRARKDEAVRAQCEAAGLQFEYEEESAE